VIVTPALQVSGFLRKGEQGTVITTLDHHTTSK
jgi:hypothetical protein